jgi:hypothetical protein
MIVNLYEMLPGIYAWLTKAAPGDRISHKRLELAPVLDPSRARPFIEDLTKPGTPLTPHYAQLINCSVHHIIATFLPLVPLTQGF